VRRACAGLIHIHDELIAKLPVEDLIRSGRDRVGNNPIQASERRVRFGRGLLDEDGGRDEIGMRAKTADLKILHGAGRLHAVIGLGRDVQLAQRIALGAERHSR